MRANHQNFTYILKLVIWITNNQKKREYKMEIEYNKNYYEDRDIRPEENIFLKLTIMPFGEITGSSKINN